MTRSRTIPQRATPRRRRTFHPRAEGLEGRLLLSAGDLDTATFNPPDGYVRWSSPAAKNSIPSDYAHAVEIQTDGKILVAGGTGSLNSSDRFEVARLLPNGALDTTFGSSGLAVPLSGGYLNDMALQPDGRILLAGTVAVTTGSGKNVVTQYDIALVRLLANGTLDTSFGQGGKVITGVSTSGNKADGAYAVALQPDGKIVVGGYTDGGFISGLDSLLVRYNTNGSLDDGSANDSTPGDSFGQGGKVVTAWSAGDDNIFDLKIQSDGKIVVAGKGYGNGNGSYPYFLARYNANGSLDDGSTNDSTPGDSLGASGIVTTPFGGTGSGGAGPGHPLVIQLDGAIVFGRSGWNGTDIDLAICRFTTTGALDTTFGGGTGAVILNIGGSQRAEALTIQPDGKIVAAGSNDQNALIARFQPNGTLDAGFGSGGIVIRSFSTSTSYFNDIALQSDGKLVAVGMARVPAGKTTAPAFLIARYLGDPVTTGAASTAPLSTATSTTAEASDLVSASLTASNDEVMDLLASDLIASKSKKSHSLVGA
jgi:uncharacterized delta-60 repeat protein